MPAVSYSELETTLRRAQAPSSSEQRRAAIDALLAFARSDSRPQQLKAAKHFPELYQTCTEYQDTIHEAILDLCEDSKEEVRIAGYNTIVELSKVGASIHRKNADVLCQLLQCDGEKELQNVRVCLSEHIRIAPEATYSIMMEYLLTNSDGVVRRGPLTEKIFAYLLGGGTYILETDHVIEGRYNSAIYRRLDAEGGKGAILEVSWMQNNKRADSILTAGIHRVLPHITASEAKKIVVDVLFSLQSHCNYLSIPPTDTLRALVQITINHLRREILQQPSDLQDTTPWLEILILTLHPVSLPFLSTLSHPMLPRADPSVFLTALNQWFIPPNCWRKFTHRVQIIILQGIGTGLKACQQILQAKTELPLPEELVSSVSQARDRILDHTDHIFVVSSKDDKTPGPC
ncbi:hypothetical protein CPB86DRAFT_73249 [Serendipita vermifera]|nr:hypothetical protein CPB86DRAFT_73249 [Serendipita vermifera]